MVGARGGGAAGGGGAAICGAGPKAPLGGTVDGAGGFLFKPASESDGNAVVLVPEELTGQVAEVVIRDSQGNVLDVGRFTGSANGGRDHFRFDRPGAAFPEDVSVELRLTNGQTRSVPIDNPALRYD